MDSAILSQLNNLEKGVGSEVMSQSFPTGYIPPGQPGEKFFLSELIPATLANFLSNSLPRGKK